MGPGDRRRHADELRQCQCLYRRRRQQHGGRSVADGLQASTNKAYVGMESGYPSRSADGDLAGGLRHVDGQFRLAGVHGCQRQQRHGKDNLNRVVSNQGTKASGQTWTVDVSITLS